jgi:hypothetical protein
MQVYERKRVGARSQIFSAPSGPSRPISPPSAITSPIPNPAEQPGSFERGRLRCRFASVTWCLRAYILPTTCIIMWQFDWTYPPASRTRRSMRGSSFAGSCVFSIRVSSLRM